MSSEQMRMELESFVNRGLREGWVGWPVKGRTGEEAAFGGPLYLAPAARNRLAPLQTSLSLEAISLGSGLEQARSRISWS